MGPQHRPLGSFTFFITVLIVLLGSASSARAQAGLLVYVPNQTANNVSVFRTNADGTLTAVTTIAVGVAPAAAIVRADQAFAYVSNSSTDTVSVIDTKTQTVVQTIAAGDGPRGLALNPDNTRLYVANNDTGANSVTVYGVAEGTGLLATLTTLTSGLNGPRHLVVSPDGSKLYVANQAGNSVRVFDTSTNSAVTTIAVGNQPINIAVNPAGTRGYVTNFTDNSVTVVDLSSDTVVATPTLGAGAGPTNVIVSPDGTHYYVANSSAGTIAQFDANSNTTIAPAISTSGLAIFGLGITPTGGFVYATNQQNDLIALFSVGADGVLSSVGTQAIGLGNSNPNGLGICGANGNKLLAPGLTFVANTAAAIGCTLDTPVLTGGTFLINNAGLVFPQTFTVNGASAIRTNGNDAELSGLLTGGGGFTKQGLGVLTLSGPQSNPGPMTIESGTLRINGALDATTSIVVPASTILEGRGSIGGPVTVAGTVRPGSPSTAPGTLTTGTITFSSTARLSIGIDGSTAGTGYDVLRVIGNVNLGGATLTTTLGFTPTPGQTFTIVDNLGTSPITGTFAGLPEGTTFDVGGTPMLISYTGGNGNDVTLYVTPVAPVLVTSASPGGALGTALFDTATLTGGASPTGTLTFTLYGPDDAACSTAVAFLTSRAVAGNGSYQSAAFTPSAQGVYRWVANYSGDGNNAAVTTACGDPVETVTIGKSNQTISFGALPPRNLGDSPFTVSATASSGLAVTFSSLTPSVCTVSGNTVTLVAGGTCTIAADQAGDASYNPAPQVTRSFTVTSACSGIAPSQLPFGVVGLNYSQTLTLSGGTAPVTWTISGALPSGVTFNNGVFSGKPAARGSFPLTVSATDAGNCQASSSLTLAISAERRLLVGTGAGGGGATRAFNIGGATAALAVNSGSAFAGGVTVAEADVDGNGVADVITGAGPGGSPTVTVFDGGSGVPKLAFFALASNFTGGVSVAAGDVTGDGLPEILVAPGCGSAAPSAVRAFDGTTGAPVRDYALSSITGCGLHVAAGDVNGDGVADIVVGSASLGPSFVRVINGSTSETIREFFPYTSAYTGGVFVGAGDVNGDGFADVVTGAGAGGTPHVRIFDGTSGNQIAGALGSFLAYPSGFAGGVRVAAGDLNGDGRAEVITGAGPGGGPHVRVFDGATTSEIFGLFAFDPSFGGGVFVAAPVPSARMAVDIPAARTAGTEVRVAGWALREISGDTNGNDAIHVWAFPVGGGAPVFVGAAPKRVARPDVAAFFGGEFLMSGFDFTGTLASGSYDLVVYARNTRTLRFDQVRVFRVTVQ
jgi:fibronectin-binding autotransporter adhesin